MILLLRIQKKTLKLLKKSASLQIFLSNLNNNERDKGNSFLTTTKKTTIFFVQQKHSCGAAKNNPVSLRFAPNFPTRVAAAFSQSQSCFQPLRRSSAAPPAGDSDKRSASSLPRVSSISSSMLNMLECWLAEVLLPSSLAGLRRRTLLSSELAESFLRSAVSLILMLGISCGATRFADLLFAPWRTFMLFLQGLLLHLRFELFSVLVPRKAGFVRGSSASENKNFKNRTF